MEEHDKGLNNCCFEKLRISINLYDNRCKVLSFLWAFQIEFSPSIRYCSPLRFGFVCSIMWSISIIWIFQKGRSPNERNQMMQYAFTISRLLGQIEPNYMTGLVDALRQDVYISESLPSESEAKICRGQKGKISRRHDKRKCQKSREYRGKKREIAAMSRRIL